MRSNTAKILEAQSINLQRIASRGKRHEGTELAAPYIAAYSLDNDHVSASMSEHPGPHLLSEDIDRGQPLLGRLIVATRTLFHSCRAVSCCQHIFLYTSVY